MTEPIIATKEMVEGIFDGAADIYDQIGPHIFSQFGGRLVDLMEIPQGARVLDVGTGTGAIAVAAARQVGFSGQVIGIDLSNEMLSKAFGAVSASGLTNIQLGRMDAEHLEFADQSFDAVTCGFSLFFVPSMERALQEMHRVLRAGGRIGLSVWGKAPPPFDPAWKIFADMVRQYDVEVRVPNKVAYGEPEIVSLVTQSGFIKATVKSETSMVVYKTEEDWWAFQMSLGSRAAILRMSDEKRNQFKAEYADRLLPLFRTDGLPLPAPVLYVMGQKP